MSTATAVNPPVVPSGTRSGGPAWNVALLFPDQGEWTEADYLALDTNRLVELVDGYLEVLPMAIPLHQRIVQFLFKLLEAFVIAHVPGEVFVAPMPIRLQPRRFREPDVMYLRPERLTDPRRQPDGADLAIEVVSEGDDNRERDLVTKRQEYAQARIAEYWIVDPEKHQITVLTLDGQTYREHGVFGKGSRATSVLLRGFAADVDAVFAAGQKANS